MMGLDTNVLVRYITQDDPVQSPEANKIIDSLTTAAPGFISHIVLVELIWVMQSCYQASRSAIAHMLDLLLSTDSLVIEQADTARRALRKFQNSSATDYVDCLIERAAHHAGCRTTVTFDQKAAKGVGMKLIRA